MGAIKRLWSWMVKNSVKLAKIVAAVRRIMRPTLAITLCFAMLGSTAGCWSATNKKTTTTVYEATASEPKKTVTVTEEYSDEKAFYDAKMAMADKRKPIMEMEADNSGIIEIKAKTITVWGYPQHGGIGTYEPAWKQALINGMGIFGNVLLAGVGLYYVNEITKSVGSVAGTRYDNSFNPSGGSTANLGNGAVTVGSNNPVTTTSTSASTTSNSHNTTDSHDASGQ